MSTLADTVIERMGHVFPELPARADFIRATILGEERRFLRTLDQGLTRLEAFIADAKARGDDAISGAQAFFLHDTLGLPFEVTRDIVEEQGLTVDESGYHEEREAQRARARAAGAFEMEDDAHAQLYPTLYEWIVAQSTDRSLGYAPYNGTEVDTYLVGLLHDDDIVTEATEGAEVELLLSDTCFYVESGGQVSDTGRIVGPDWEVSVADVRRPIENMVLHVGRVVRGTLHVGDAVTAEVDRERRSDTMRNHTATHLLHRALREVLGSHVQQAGSVVAPERLRFDYNHSAPMTAEQRGRIERIVTDAVLANYEVSAREEAYRDALDQGVIALFEEKYGNVVRVLRVGSSAAPFSQELCGGTHVSRTGDIGPFLILSEGGIGAGIRRIEATTGHSALEAIQRLRERQEHVTAALNCPADEINERIERLQEELRAAQREAEQLARKLARADFQALLDGIIEVEGIPVLAARVDAPDAETLREMADWFRDKMQGGVIVLGAVVEGKPLLISATTRELTQTRGVHAGNLVRSLAQMVGGGGGGRPEMAQAGGRDASKLADALNQVPDLLRAMLT